VNFSHLIILQDRKLTYASLLEKKKKAQSIIKKWKKALQEKEESASVIAELTAQMNEEWIVEWRQLEQNATTQRGEALRIYDVVDQNSEIFIFYFVNTICLNEICIPKLRAVLKFAWNYWRQKGGLDSFL